MPPREEEETMALVANQQQTNSPTSWRPLRAKSFLSEEDVIGPSLSCSSIRSLSERSITLIEMVEGEDSNGSLLVDACRGCLQNQVTSMVDDAQSLMEQNTGNDEFTWRASLAQLQADTYLQVIESALMTSDRELVEEELKFFVNSIATQLGRDEKKNEENPSALVRISAWKMPELAFEVTVSDPAKYALTCKPKGPPLSLEARAITELLAEDIVGEKKSTPSPQACIVHLEQCTHESRPYSDSSGTTGAALVKVRVSPANEKIAAATKKGRSWRESKTVGSGGLKVKEARIVQVNAVPPRPKSTVDLYLSTNHGDDDTTLTMRFQTYKTLNDEAPEVHIEVVMEG